jgi:hypothetical protein
MRYNEYTREYLAIQVERTFRGADVMAVRDELAAIRGVPVHIRSDNGPELVLKVVCSWCAHAGTGTLFIEPGAPSQTGSWRASTAGCATSCCRRRPSRRWPRPSTSSTGGGSTTTTAGPSVRWASEPRRPSRHGALLRLRAGSPALRRRSAGQGPLRSVNSYNAGPMRATPSRPWHRLPLDRGTFNDNVTSPSGFFFGRLLGSRERLLLVLIANTPQQGSCSLRALQECGGSTGGHRGVRGVQGSIAHPIRDLPKSA